MSDPSAKNTRSAAHTRRIEKHENKKAPPSEGPSHKKTPPSEGPPQSEPEKTAVHTEATASTEVSQLTPIAETPQDDSMHLKGESDDQHLRSGYIEEIPEITDEPQYKPEQSFATAPSSIRRTIYMGIFDDTPERDPSTPEMH
jgi:hypothetical protein